MKKPRILSVVWHGVRWDSTPPELLDGSNPTASVFKSHVQFLMRNYTPISIEDFLRIVDGEHSLHAYARPPVLLGFDDGFRSVVVNGLPILTQLGVPAVFFVIAEVLRDPEFVPWFVEMTHLIRKAKRKQFVYRGVNFDIARRPDAARMRRLIDVTFRACRSEEERQRLLSDLADTVDVPRPVARELDEDLRFVTNEDLGTLSASSILAVASHGMTHRHLASLGYEEQRYELTQSDSVLRAHCPSYRPVVAYPAGSFDATTIDIARGIYRAGFAVFLDSSYRNWYAYPRVSISGCTVEELAYKVSSLRRNLLLPLKRGLHSTGLLSLGR